MPTPPTSPQPHLPPSPSLGDVELLERTLAWGFDSPRFERIAELARARIERLSDLAPTAGFLFAGRLPITKEQFAGTKLD